jgi:hypothetical protein
MDSEIKLSGSLEVRGKVVKLSGSPTATLKSDFAQALYNGTGLSKIDKIALVDTGDTERDSTTNLTYNIVGNSLQIQGTINITANYTIAKLRLYAGTKLYFETAVSEQKSVTSGDTVVATESITLNLTGTLANYSLVLDYIRNTFYNVLSGNATTTALNVSTVRIYVYNINTQQTIYYNQTPTKSISSNQVTWSTSLTLDYDFELRNIEIYAGTTRLYYWNLTGTPPSGSAGTAISYSETFTA